MNVKLNSIDSDDVNSTNLANANEASGGARFSKQIRASAIKYFISLLFHAIMELSS